MTHSLNAARQTSLRLTDKARESIARRAEQRDGVGGGYRHGGNMPDSPFGSYATMQDNANNAQRQYQANKGSSAIAIRPIAMKGASLPIRCGFAQSKPTGTKDGTREWLIEKWYENHSRGWVDTDSARIRSVKKAMPLCMKDLNNSDIDPLKDHFLLRLLSNPNEHYRGSALKYLSFSSLVLTGRFVWWFDDSGAPRTDDPELGNLRVWYIPRHWLMPNPVDEGKWTIMCPGMAGGVEVNAGQLFISSIPDPENPFRPYSPLQSQAASVDSEDKMLKAQAVTLDNVIRPSVILVAGRLPGAPGGGSGRGPRPILSPDQREQLINAIKLTHANWRNYGEPAIVDGLIEDIKPFMASPSELDFGNSVASSGRRIMEGIGTSPVIAGFTENANRAGSQVAKEVFNEITLNPLVNFVSEDMNSVLGPRFTIGSRRLHIWMDQSQSTDPDMLAARVVAAMDRFSDEEIREWVQTGELNLKAVIDDEAKRIKREVAASPVADVVAPTE